MNTKDLRDEFEHQVIKMKLTRKGTLSSYWNGQSYDKEHINDAWEDFKKEKNKTKKV